MVLQSESESQSDPGDLIVVGDIGGTNGRFALAATGSTGQPPSIQRMFTYPCAEFSDLTSLVATFLRDVGEPDPLLIRLAIAGPTSKRMGHLTNLGWDADATFIEQTLNLRNVEFLNDFGALAYSTTVLREPKILQVKSGFADQDGVVSVMGPGTGFGVSLFVRFGQDRAVVPTEGGHMRFAPVTQLEADLCASLSEQQDHISIETLLCGRGLQRIHQFIVNYGGSGDASLRPDQITAAALDQSEPSCVRAVQIFLSILGSAAGDIALAHGARGGVYLGGGILPNIASFVERSNFVKRFSAKGPMSGYLENIPVYLIVSGDAALIGAAVAPDFS
jgi:glucokinase